MSESHPTVTEFNLPDHVNKAELIHSKFINGIFENPFEGWVQPTPMMLFKWKLFTKSPHSPYPKIPDENLVNEHIQSCQPRFVSAHKTNYGGNPESMAVTWLGHATVLVETDGVALITDPVFSDHCAPSFVSKFANSSPIIAYLTSAMKRFLNVPCQVTELPETLRFVLISHNHFDHMDDDTCFKIAEHFGEKIIWCVPKGNRETMLEMLPEYCEKSVFEFDWWEGANFHLPSLNKTFSVVCTPCQHWSARGILDHNQALWSSWVFISKASGRKFFFGGDTGYCEVFKQIGRVFGSFDLAAIPIGAYEPREIMGPQHVNPDEAVEIHKDINSKMSVGVHWGTFALADEGFLDPEIRLMQLVGLPRNRTAKQLKDPSKNLSLVERVKQSGLKISFVTVNCGQTYKVADH